MGRPPDTVRFPHHAIATRALSLRLPAVNAPGPGWSMTIGLADRSAFSCPSSSTMCGSAVPQDTASGNHRLASRLTLARRRPSSPVAGRGRASW